MNKKHKVTILLIIIVICASGAGLLTRYLVLDSVNGNIVFYSTMYNKREAGVYTYSFNSKEVTRVCAEGFDGLKTPTVQNGSLFICSARQISDGKIYLIKIQNSKAVDKIGLEEYPCSVKVCGNSIYFTYGCKLYIADFCNKTVSVIAEDLTLLYPSFSSLYSGYNKLIFARDLTTNGEKYELWLYENGKESLMCTADYCGGFISENEALVCDNGKTKIINIYSHVEKTISKTNYIFPYVICNGRFLIASTVDAHLAEYVYLVNLQTGFKSSLRQFTINVTSGMEWFETKTHDEQEG